MTLIGTEALSAPNINLLTLKKTWEKCKNNALVMKKPCIIFVRDFHGEISKPYQITNRGKKINRRKALVRLNEALQEI